MENKMRILFGHVANVGDVVSHNDVRHREIRRWAVWQVTDDETVRLATVFVNHDEIGDVVGPTRLDQLLEFVVTTI